MNMVYIWFEFKKTVFYQIFELTDNLIKSLPYFHSKIKVAVVNNEDSLRYILGFCFQAGIHKARKLKVGICGVRCII